MLDFRVLSLGDMVKPPKMKDVFKVCSSLKVSSNLVVGKQPRSCIDPAEKITRASTNCDICKITLTASVYNMFQYIYIFLPRISNVKPIEFLMKIRRFLTIDTHLLSWVANVQTDPGWTVYVYTFYADFAETISNTTLIDFPPLWVSEFT